MRWSYSRKRQTTASNHGITHLGHVSRPPQLAFLAKAQLDTAIFCTDNLVDMDNFAQNSLLFLNKSGSIS
jgi:hypothetical protein